LNANLPGTIDARHLADISRRLRALREAVPPVEPPSVRLFVERCTIVEKESGDLLPFTLWPAQVEALETIIGADYLVAVKGRQVGMTSLELAAMLWAATFWPNRLFLIARQSLDYAQDAIRRLRILRLRLPDHFREPVTQETTMVMQFANGSRFEALTATQEIGRGLAAYWTLADEAAFWPWPDIQIPVLEAGSARMHIVSTGHGPGDTLHRIWRKANLGEGLYTPLFIPSSADARRTSEWRRRNVDEAAEPRLAQREYAETPEDAFASPEGVFFERFDALRNVAELQVVPNWQTVRAVDFGYRFAACLWLQSSPAGQPFVVAELAPKDCTTDEFAAEIKRVDASLGLAIAPSRTYCDPAGNAANVQTAQSEVQILRAAGLLPISRPSSIRDGCVRVMAALADPVLPLVVSRSCPHLVEALSNVRPDKHRPDLYDETSDYCHILDALRYWSVNRSAAGTVHSSPIAGGRPITAGLVGRQF